MLFGLWISVLFRHAKINHMDDIGRFRVWSANEEIVGFDISVYEVLFVYGLDAGELRQSERVLSEILGLTICFATITTVLMENLLLQ